MYLGTGIKLGHMISRTCNKFDKCINLGNLAGVAIWNGVIKKVAIVNCIKGKWQ